MKRIVLLSYLLVQSTQIFSQETLYANDTHTVALFFPSPIRQAVTGAENFTFSYNRKAGQHFGLLQANKGDISNLLVITQDGRVYSYGLEYRKELPENFRFITIPEGIGRETEIMVLGEAIDSTPIPKPIEVPKTDPMKELWEKGAEYVLGRKTRVIKTKRKDGLVLRLKEIFYHQDEVYLELEIINRSAIDFEVDVLEIYRVNGKKSRQSSHQKIPLVPKIAYNFSETVRTGKKHSFVFVIPKFTLGNAEKLLLELHEKNGNRMLTLKAGR